MSSGAWWVLAARWGGPLAVTLAMAGGLGVQTLLAQQGPPGASPIRAEVVATLGLDEFCCFSIETRVLRTRAGHFVAAPTFDGGTVAVFDSAGSMSGTFGREGAGPGEFRQIRGIALLSGDTIAVWGSPERVALFSPDGAYARTVRPEGITGIRDLVERPDGSLAVSGVLSSGPGAGARTVSTVDREGEVIQAVPLPGSPSYRIEARGDGTIWFTLPPDPGLYRLDPGTGEALRSTDFAWPWAGDDRGTVWGLQGRAEERTWVAGARVVPRADGSGSTRGTGQGVALPPPQDMESVAFWLTNHRSFIASVAPDGTLDGFGAFPERIFFGGWVGEGLIASPRELDSGEIVIDVLRVAREPAAGRRQP